MKKNTPLPAALYEGTRKGKRGKAEFATMISFRISEKFVLEMKRYCKKYNVPKANFYRHCIMTGYNSMIETTEGKETSGEL